MAPIDDGFNGDDFSNNLFTDLAPLLSLFGEQVTKQFLSLSTDWTDNVLLAMGPLGIVTVVVSAIRVGGGPWLKALVGRAREEKAVIEQELLSSTSDEVCELWNGKSIVRTKGKPPKLTETLVITDEGRVFPFHGEVLERGIIYEFGDRSHWPGEFPPANLTLNLRSPKSQLQERRWLAAFGLLLQFAGLAVSGIAPKKWGWTQSGNKDEPYAYPFYLGGSLLLFCGMIACGHIIEAATKETVLICRPEYRKKVAVVRFQAACTVGDQHFPNGAIFNPFDNPDICISTLHMQPRRYLAPVATAVTMVGFLIQFVGLRSLHWSAAVIQLGVTVIMTLVRAFARRGLSMNPPFFEIPNRITLETEEVWGGWLAWSLAFVAQDSAGGQVDWNAKLENGHRNTFEFAPGQLFTKELYGIEYFKGMASTSQARDFLHVNKTPATAISCVQPQAITNTEELRTWYKAIRAIKDVAYLSGPRIVDPVFEKARAVSGGIHRILMIVKPLRSDTAMWRPESSFLEDGRDGEIHWGIDVVQQWKHAPLAANRNSLTETVTLQSVAISLGLGTEPDARLNSEYISRQTEFRVDLAALLLLWRYSLAVAGWDYSDRSAFGIAQKRRKFGRIVGVDPPHLICKTSLLAEWMNRSLVPPLDPEEWDLPQEPSTLFGMYLSTLSHSVDFPQGPWTENEKPPERHSRELIIFDSEETTYTEQMARELFSLFVLALAAEMQQVPGRTTKTEERRWANTFFDSLAEEAVKAKLAKDLDDALTLVIPAFARYGLLPKQYTDEEHASSSSAAEPHVPDHSPSIRQRRSGAPNEQSGTPQDRS